MNPINIRLCKELWDNFDKCGWEARLIEPSTTLVCVHSPSLHAQKGARGGHSTGLGAMQREGEQRQGGLSPKEDVEL